MAGQKAGKVIQVKVWAKRGGLLVRTNDLPFDDPDSEYQQIIAAGGIPEEYGIMHPVAEEFKGKSREELVQEIINLRAEIDSRHFHGMMYGS